MIYKEINKFAQDQLSILMQIQCNVILHPHNFRWIKHVYAPKDMKGFEQMKVSELK